MQMTEQFSSIMEQTYLHNVKIGKREPKKEKRAMIKQIVKYRD